MKGVSISEFIRCGRNTNGILSSLIAISSTWANETRTIGLVVCRWLKLSLLLCYSCFFLTGSIFLSLFILQCYPSWQPHCRPNHPPWKNKEYGLWDNLTGFFNFCDRDKLVHSFSLAKSQIALAYQVARLENFLTGRQFLPQDSYC